jgi:dTDP-4-dehydrorhamnose 3,5-epimerase
MKVTQQKIPGLYIIEPVVHQDERGMFLRSFCKESLAENGVRFDALQGNISVNSKKKTLRGFHYQADPTRESKILNIISGAIYNVVIDLRYESETYGIWEALEVDSEIHASIHVPAGCANAFLTLTENTIVHYYMGACFRPETYRGIRYDDPTFNVDWPFKPDVISSRDLGFPDFHLAR